MGTAMNLFVEKRNADGRWEYVHAPGQPPRVANRTEPPIDWYHDAHLQSYDTMAFLAGVRNNDDMPELLPKWRGVPEDASEELKAAYEWNLEAATWVLLSEIKGFDLDQLVWKPARKYSDETIASSRARGYELPEYDIQSRRSDGSIPADYELRQFPYREVLDEFDALIPFIETACDTTPDNIRLVMWFDW